MFHEAQCCVRSAKARAPAENFCRMEREPTLAEQDIANEIFHRVPLTPPKVNVRDPAGRVADVQKEGRDRVRHRWGLGPQYAVTAHVRAAYLQFAAKL